VRIVAGPETFLGSHQISAIYYTGLVCTIGPKNEHLFYEHELGNILKLHTFSMKMSTFLTKYLYSLKADINLKEF
jgi:hypothetical protein